MEKPLVTFAVTAHGLTGRLGQPVMVISLDLASDPQALVILRTASSGFHEVARCPLPQGPFTAGALAIVQAHVVAELYTAMVLWKGVQAELEVPDR